MMRSKVRTVKTQSEVTCTLFTSRRVAHRMQMMGPEYLLLCKDENVLPLTAFTCHERQRFSEVCCRVSPGTANVRSGKTDRTLKISFRS